MLAIIAQRGTQQPRLIDVPVPPAPAAGEVLCRTLELGVCGTDREILHSENPLAPAGGDYLILGHECLARIEQVGLGVQGFAAGDLVVPVVRRAMPGQARRPDLLPFGTFTERGIVREHGFSQPLWIDRPEYLFSVPAEIADLAVLAEPLSIAEKAVNEATLLAHARLCHEPRAAREGHISRSEMPPVETWMPRVLVTGMGPIGFTAVLAAIARGWQVTMLGRDEPTTFRSRLVERLGGSYQQIDSVSMDVANVEREGYDLLLECTGNEAVMVQAADLVRSCGVVVWLGSSRRPQPTTVNLQRLMREGLLRNHIHLGCVNAAPRDFADALEHLSGLAASRRGELAALITARVRAEESLWHYEHRQPQGIKTVLMYGEESSHG
jgi:threonine dehydrogenase-like Zn-dependent dehydrogenase